MKKMISLLMVIMMIVTLITVSDLSIQAVEKEYQYESLFKSYAAEHGYKPLSYEEIDSGDYWTLVYAKSEGDSCDKLIKGVFGDRVIVGYDDRQPFTFGYGVFWRRVGFVPLTEVWNNPYFEGLQEMFRKYTDTILTEEACPVWLLGDTDRDGRLTVMDATHIQRRLASIEAAPFYDTLPEAAASRFGADIRFLSDVDRDGMITVLDSTTIQKRLASLITEEKLDYKILANTADSSSPIFDTSAKILSSVEELKENREFFSDKLWDETLSFCDEGYFRERVLLMYTDCESSSGYERRNFSVIRDKNFDLRFEQEQVLPSTSGATVMTNRLILLELSRNDVPKIAGVNPVVKVVYSYESPVSD